MAAASMSLAIRAAPSGLRRGAPARPASPSAARPAGVARCAVSAAGVSSVDAVAAPSRKSWLPGSTLPAYLDGSLAGDTGFDPLGLAEDPEALRWYVQAELIHSRLAMAGVGGMLGTDILRTSGLAPGLPVWFEAGAANYSLAGTPTLLAIQLILYAFVEFKRWGDFKSPGSQGDYKQAFFFFIEPALAGTANGYPGGPLFDPLSMAVDFDSPQVKDLKDKELANGRLAMLAALGFFVQAKVTGVGPVDNLLAHLADPWHTTVLSFLP